MINKAILIGRLTRDVELKTISTSGNAVVNNSLAVSRFRTSSSGERIEETLFIDVVFYSRMAEIVHQYLRKGSKIAVDGYLQQQNWTDAQTGQNRSKIILVAENMEMLDGKVEGESMNNNQNTFQRPTNNTYQQNPYTQNEQRFNYQNNMKNDYANNTFSSKTTYINNPADDAEIPF